MNDLAKSLQEKFTVQLFPTRVYEEAEKETEKKGNKNMYYSLINYFDVIGNKTDGYEVNNQCVEFNDWYISDDATHKEILDYLVKRGYLNTSDMRKVKIDDMGDYMEVYAVKDHYPLFGIVPNVL